MKNDVVKAIIEIPYRSRNKYEVDHETKRIKLDRVLYSAMAYPAEYGFLENTLALDGDPLDILVIGTEPTYPGCIVPARVVGYLEVIDNGFEDYKLISVVDVDPRYNEVNELSDLSTFILDEIKNFFENYKTLQDIEVKVSSYHSKKEALELIKKCKERYDKKASSNG
jgi:inorganic pyrophosphatase